MKRKLKTNDKKITERKCYFKENNISHIDYKDKILLNRFISKKTGSILPRKYTGTCAKMQRKLAIAIKRSREIGLLPFTIN